MPSIRFLTIASLFLAATLLCRPAFSQDTTPTPEQQQMQQQMRESFQTIMQNMQDKGIDPRQFFQQLQEGADPADIQKQLIDQGVIDQKTIDTMQSNMKKMMSNGIKTMLKATDQEWTVLEPLIEKVQAASAAAGQQGMGGFGMGGFITKQSDSAVELAKAKKALAAAVKDPATTPDQFNAALKAFRDARQKVRDELDAARKELISALTIHQEGLLTMLGLLE